MQEKEKSLWVDRRRRVLAFHPIEESEKVTKAESEFWSLVLRMTSEGYKLM